MFNGKAFLMGLQRLDSASKELFHHHGKPPNGRLSFVEMFVDDAMMRLAGSEPEPDTDLNDPKDINERR